MVEDVDLSKIREQFLFSVLPGAASLQEQINAQVSLVSQSIKLADLLAFT